MQKKALAAAIALAVGTSAAHADSFNWTGTFLMYSPGGGNIWTDKTAYGTFEFTPGLGAGVPQPSVGGFTTTATPFYGYKWTAHDYTLTETIAGNVSAQIPFDWGGPSTTTSCGVASCNIPVVALFDFSPTGGGNYLVTTLDGDNDGIPGTKMTAGPFAGFSPVFTGPAVQAVPVPAALWLFGSGLVGLASVARRKASKTT